MKKKLVKSLSTPVRFDARSMEVIVTYMETKQLHNRNLAINDLIHNVGMALELRYEGIIEAQKIIRKHNIRQNELF